MWKFISSKVCLNKLQLCFISNIYLFTYTLIQITKFLNEIFLADVYQKHIENGPPFIKKMYPFKHNNNLNKRWDVRNHPFYANVINGKNIHDMNISLECSSININESFKQDLLEGKYDQM